MRFSILRPGRPLLGASGLALTLGLTRCGEKVEKADLNSQLTARAGESAAKAAVPDLEAMLQTDDRDQMTAVANALRAIDPSAVAGVKVENVSN